MSDDSLKKFISQAKERSSKSTHLLEEKHPQKDFFVADVFDCISFRIDMESMELPIFALKAGDMKTRVFQTEKGKLEVVASAKYGLATVHDKDIWIYCVSKLIQAINEGKEISQTIRFTIYDYLVTTNRDTGGSQYDYARHSLERLASTRMTEEWQDEKRRYARGFGLVDEWTVIEEKDGRMVRVAVKLPDWLYASVLNMKVLKLHSDYFRLRKALDRRIYELARKHCGNQYQFKISLALLHQKTGATSILRAFRFSIKSLAESNALPDYDIKFDTTTDMVIFTNKGPKALEEYNKAKLKTLMKRIKKDKN